MNNKVREQQYGNRYQVLYIPPLSTIAESDFHACQERIGLQPTKIDQDVRTRWRSSHSMAEQLVYNKEAVLEMDKNPAYKDPGEISVFISRC